MNKESYIGGVDLTPDKTEQAELKCKICNKVIGSYTGELLDNWSGYCKLHHPKTEQIICEECKCQVGVFKQDETVKTTLICPNCKTKIVVIINCINPQHNENRAD